MLRGKTSMISKKNEHLFSFKINLIFLICMYFHVYVHVSKFIYIYIYINFDEQLYLDHNLLQ